MMYRSAVSSVLSTLLFFSVNAFAVGDKGGNGGGAHFCPNPTPTQIRMEAYDLWFGKNPLNLDHALDIPAYDGFSTKQDYLNRAIEKVARKSPAFASSIRIALKILEERLRKNTARADGRQARPMEVHEVADAHLLQTEPGCEYRQLVNWIDDPQILKMHGLDQEIVLRDEIAYDAMDPLNRAANDFHEAVYKVARLFRLIGDAGSLPVQRMTAETFSTSEIQAETLERVSRYGGPSLLENTTPPTFASYKYSNAIYVYLSPECTRAKTRKVKFTVRNSGDFTVKVRFPDNDGSGGDKEKLEAGRAVSFLSDVREERESGRIYYGDDILYVGTAGIFPSATRPPQLDITVDACGEIMKRTIQFPDWSWVNLIVLPSPLF